MSVQKLSGCLAQRSEAQAVLFGTRFRGDAPAQPVRDASVLMETFSPYQRTDLPDVLVHDAGDADLPDDAMQATDAVESMCGSILDEGKLPAMLATDHVLAYGAIRAAAARHEDLRVLHFGARANLKREHEGEQVAEQTVMRRVWDLLGDKRIYQFGVRSGSKEEFEWGRPPRVRMERFSTSGIDSCTEALASVPVYITLDLSVIDPGELLGTRRPNAGGVTYLRLHDTLMSMNALWVVGFDICGFSPELDDRRASSASMVFKLMREMLIAFA